MAQLIKGKQIGVQTVTINGSSGNVVAEGDLDMSSYNVIISSAPTLDTQAANKAYVDSVAQGLYPHAPVLVISSTGITLSGTQTIDGVSLSVDDSVLVNGQADKTTNGIYLVKSGAWTRREDADGTPAHEIQLGDFVFVESGTTNHSSGWVLADTDATGSTITPDVNTQEWVKMAAPGSYTASEEGIKLTGSQFYIDIDGSTLAQSASGIKVADSLVTQVSTNQGGITSLSTAVSTESSTRASADTSLSTALSSEISTTGSEVTSLSTAISTEGSTRASADTSLSTAISSGNSGVVSLSTALSTEISTTDSEVTSLSTAVSTETSTRASADTSLSTAVSTETSTRASADTSLSTAISSESSTRASADTSLSTALSTEISTTDSDVTSLSSAISAVSGDTLDITTILNNGEVLGLSSGQLTGFTYTTDFTSLETAISTESSTRASADTSLSTAISTEISATNSDVTSLSTGISSESSQVDSLSTALSSEVSTRSSADTSLSTAISSESSTRASADTSLSTALSTEISTTDSEVTSLSTAISSGDSGVVSLSTALSTEISTTDSEVTSLSTAVSTESSTRASADTSLSTALSTESSTRASADTSLSTALSTEISTTDSEVTSLSTAISSIANPEFVENNITPENSGSTTAVVVATSGFTALAAGESVDEDSVVVYLNGIAYIFEYAQGSPAVFHTNGVVPSTSATTLYFDGVEAGFAIEADDDVKLKYVVVS